MKKKGLLLLVFALLTGFTACGGTPAESLRQPESLPQADSTAPSTAPHSVQSEAAPATVDTEKGVLVAYYSRTGSTAEVAALIHAEVGGDLVRIETVEPYPAEYNEALAQAREEQQAGFRPALATQLEGMEDYDVIFLGYPIWHGDVPMAILSFLEGYDWSGKTVVPFCTHGGGGAYGSFGSVAAAAPGADMEEGFSIAGSAADDAAAQVADWLSGLDFQASPNTIAGQASLRIAVGGHTLTATLAENSSAEALRQLLADGPITIDMQDYAGMEKVGDLGMVLPANDEQMSTGPGDLILYQGNSFVIYYGANSWSLTRLGKIDAVSGEQLKEILGTGDVTVTLSLSE